MRFSNADLIYSEETEKIEKEQIKNIINATYLPIRTILNFFSIGLICLFVWAIFLQAYSFISVPLLTFRKIVVLILLFAWLVASVIFYIRSNSQNKHIDILEEENTGVIRCKLLSVIDKSLFIPNSYIVSVKINGEHIRTVKVYCNNNLSKNKDIWVVCNAKRRYFQGFCL